MIECIPLLLDVLTRARLPDMGFMIQMMYHERRLNSMVGMGYYWNKSRSLTPR